MNEGIRDDPEQHKDTGQDLKQATAPSFNMFPG
jgi:hypothetical protein